MGPIKIFAPSVPIGYSLNIPISRKIYTTIKATMDDKCAKIYE